MEDLKIQEAQGQQVAPPNYLVRAIIGTVLCFPFGIAGIVNAARATSLWNQGKGGEAHLAASRAQTWSKVSLILGIIFWVVYSLFIFIAVLAEEL